MVAKKFFAKQLTTSLVLLCFLPLGPWFAIFWHSSSVVHEDDGPAAVLLLSFAVAGAMLTVLLYCVAAFLVVRHRNSRLLFAVAAASMCAILLFCMGSSLLWANVSMGGGMFFCLAAGMYVIASVKIGCELRLITRKGGDSVE